jgi:hypothetical protein
MERKVVIEINFNNYGMNPDRLTRGWLEDRIGIFQRLTLRSLKKQSNQNFLAVVKLAGGCSEIVEEILAQYEPLPANVQFGTSIESKRRMEAYVHGARELYVARIDSDDLYHESFVQLLHDYKPKPGTAVLISSYGYIWDQVHGSMVENFYKSPPFYTFLYSVPDFLSGYRVQIPNGGGHGNVILLPHEILAGRNYVNVIHNSNTTVKKVGKKELLSPKEMEQVLNQFMTPQ